MAAVRTIGTAGQRQVSDPTRAGTATVYQAIGWLHGGGRRVNDGGAV